jgi:hypothetical protein
MVGKLPWKDLIKIMHQQASLSRIENIHRFALGFAMLVAGVSPGLRDFFMTFTVFMTFVLTF